MEERPRMPLAQVLYGDVVYWLCVVAALVCMIGPFVALANVENNVLNPHYLFTAIWEGKSAPEVWGIKGGTFPGGHFWLRNLTTGDGLTQFGLVLGCSVALPSLILAAIAFLVIRPRQVLWACMALWVSALITTSVIGVVGAGH